MTAEIKAESPKADYAANRADTGPLRPTTPAPEDAAVDSFV
jgi:hypothetical protein